MPPITLNPTQHAILAHAIEHHGGRIEWFPEHIKGGARQKVLDGMFNRVLITTDGSHWFVAAEGYDALGMARPGIKPPMPDVDAELERAVATAEASWAPAQSKHRTRENSKQARIVQALRAPTGATLYDLMTLTGWQAHSVRGTLANLRKQHLDVVSSKDAGVRTYRIVSGV